MAQITAVIRHTCAGQARMSALKSICGILAALLSLRYVTLLRKLPLTMKLYSTLLAHAFDGMIFSVS